MPPVIAHLILPELAYEKLTCLLLWRLRIFVPPSRVAYPHLPALLWPSLRTASPPESLTRTQELGAGGSFA